jgi:PAS domain S-box-containing protein
LFLNQRWLDYTGLSAEQALGSGWQVAIHSDDLPRILETFREALNSVKPYEVEGRFRRFDGEFRWFLFRGSPLRDRSGKVAKWYGTNTDLEERKRAEEALRKSEERWRSVFENSAIGVAVTDLNARYLATNNVYQTIVGYTEEELRALDFLSLTHEDYREANWALITELVEGKRRQFQIEKKYRRKDGSLVWVSNNVSLVQRKRAEEALQRSEGYLAEAQKLTHTGSWAAQVSQYTTRAAVPVMRKQKSGHIFQVSSVGGRHAVPGNTRYHAAKWAVGGFSDSLAIEVAPFGVKVCTLEPGGIRTIWARRAVQNAPDLLPEFEASVGLFLKMLPGLDGRLEGDPRKIADVIAQLAKQR